MTRQTEAELIRYHTVHPDDEEYDTIFLVFHRAPHEIDDYCGAFYTHRAAKKYIDSFAVPCQRYYVIREEEIK